MNRTSYPQEIQNLICICESERFSDPAAVIDSAEKIHSYADEICDTSLAGYSDFCIGDAYFTKCDSEDCMRYINAAIQELHSASEWQLLGECYNLFGILCEHQGNVSDAIESYSQAILLVENHHLNVLGTMVHANLSNLLHKGGDNETALKEVLECRKYLARITEDDRYDYLPIQIQINIARTYVYLKQKDKASEELQLLERMFDSKPEQAKDFDYYLLYLSYFDLCHDTDNESLALEKAIRSFHNCEYKVDYLDDCIEFMRYLKRKNNYVLLKELVKEMDQSTTSNDFTDTLMNIQDYKIALLQHEGRWGALLDELRNYHSLSLKHKRQVYNVTKVMMDMRYTLAESEKTNFMLQKRLGTDELTGIANRQRLNDISDKFFDSALENRLYLGVEMLDIDNFKQINDTYGHQIGDLCLCTLADAMKAIEDSDIFCARYGGDEFTILFQNLSDEDIRQTTEQLRKKLVEYTSSRNLPEFTISQGICNRVPVFYNRIWDFTSLADKALYIAKRTGRNNIIILHQENDIYEYPEAIYKRND